MIDPAIAYILILSLAALLAQAALHKLTARGEFTRVLAAYGLLPQLAVPAVSALLPWAELLTALGLLFPGSRRYACGAAAALLLTYGCAMAVNLARGRRDLDCGCSLAGGRRPIAAWMLVRNAILACGAATAALPCTSRGLGVLDAVTIVAGALAAGFLYASTDALLGRVLPAAAAARAR